MILSNTPLSFILLTLAAVDASPLISHRSSKPTLRFSTRFNPNGQPSNLAEMDRARAQSMKQPGGHLSKRLGDSVSITNSFVQYNAQVKIGEPAEECKWISCQCRRGSSLILDTLLIDSGSSNIWIGANKTYTQTSSSIDTGNAVVRVQYFHVLFFELRVIIVSVLRLWQLLWRGMAGYRCTFS